MVGHKYISSTEAYLVNDLDDLQKDIEQFHLIGWKYRIMYFFVYLCYKLF